MATKHLNRPTLPGITVDPALNKYDNQVLFPEKVAKAKAMLQKVGLPKTDSAVN